MIRLKMASNLTIKQLILVYQHLLRPCDCKQFKKEWIDDDINLWNGIDDPYLSWVIRSIHLIDDMVEFDVFTGKFF